MEFARSRVDRLIELNRCRNPLDFLLRANEGIRLVPLTDSLPTLAMALFPRSCGSLPSPDELHSELGPLGLNPANLLFSDLGQHGPGGSGLRLRINIWR